MGQNLLGIEGEIAWATPGQFTVNNFPCSEDGKNCNTHIYEDPSSDVEILERIFARNRPNSKFPHSSSYLTHNSVKDTAYSLY
jgi:hypothetical protein